MKPEVQITKQQRGLTLVEMMVALTLGVLVVGGILQIFLNTKLSNNTQTGFSTLYENARIASYVLTENLMMAGFDNSTGTIAQAITATTDNNNSDSITVTSLSATDCLGVNTGGAAATNLFFIALSNGVSSLMCTGNSGTQPLAEGVENMQLLYGEDTTNDNIADLYRAPAAVTDWTRVVSIRVALLVTSIDEVASTPDVNQYVLLNAPPITPATNLLQRRRVFTKTILVRNNMM
ncbi:MAG: PilW family protein [Gammaproteobacteria bacterium]|nr:PilW family protein [Gammaproteobacteria bacterium]